MPEVTADTSVVVPAVASWHTAHLRARDAATEVSRLPTHVVLEVMAVLTRLPHGLAVSARVAMDVVRRAFPGQPLVLPTREVDPLLRAMADAQLVGGAVYDALIGATARHAGARLLSLDRRAAPAYRAVGAAVDYLEG